MALKINTENLPSVAMSFYKILSDIDLALEGLQLLKEHANKQPDWIENIRFDIQNLPLRSTIKKYFSHKLTLCQSVVVSLLNKASNPLNETLIQGLIDVDKAAFSFKDDHGRWVAFKIIKKLYQEELYQEIYQTIRHHGYYANSEYKKRDKEIALILNSLPEEAFNDEEAEKVWARNIGNGVLNGEVHQIFKKHRPDLKITNIDNNGKPFLKKATSNKSWAFFLEEGGNPFEVINGKPLWQTLLPRQTSELFNKNSFEESIEEWVAKECRIKGENADPKMRRLLERYALNRIKNINMSSWDFKQRKDILCRVPNGEGLFMDFPREERFSRHNEYKAKEPFWHVFFTHEEGSEAIDWAMVVHENPTLKARVKEVPELEAIMVALWVAKEKEIDQETLERVRKTWKTPTFKKTIKALTKDWHTDLLSTLNAGMLQTKLSMDTQDIDRVARARPRL